MQGTSPSTDLPDAMLLSSLSREAQLLLLTAGPATTEARIRELVTSDLNWQLIAALAAGAKAAPTVLKRVDEATDGRTPAAARKRLQPLAMVTQFRQVRLEECFLEVVEKLAPGDCDGVLLKGAALAVTVYDSFAERPMGDIDVLLSPSAAARVQQELLGAGWKEEYLSDPDLEHHARRQHFYQGHHHLPPLIDPSGAGAVVELHTDVCPPGHPFQGQAAGMWERARRADYGGRPVLVPDPADLLLHLCLHFAWSHLMLTGGWRTFRDINALDEAGVIDWPRFLGNAESARGQTCCYWTLRMARSLTGLVVPDEILEALRPPLPAALLDKVERHLAHEIIPSERICPSVRVRRRVWEIAFRPGWSGHGWVRPWLVSGEEPSFERADAAKGLRKSWDTIRRIPHLKNYFGALLSSRATGTASRLG